MVNRYSAVLVFVLFGLIGRSQVPVPSFSISPSVVCSGRSATLTSATPSIPVSAYSWSYSPSTGANNTSALSNSILVMQFNSAGRYTITLNWDFGTLGVSSKTMAINVVKSAESAFNASLTGYGYPNQIVLSDYSYSSTKIYWVFDKNFVTKDSSSQTSRVYPQAGTYTVTHIAVGTQGCNDTSSYSFKIAELSKIELPTLFTPNDDGVNDVFRPISEGISTLHVMIYNRYGILVREWNTVNGSWDGHTTSGVACDNGTYFVIAEGTGFDGKDYKLKGNLTLIR